MYLLSTAQKGAPKLENERALRSSSSCHILFTLCHRHIVTEFARPLGGSLFQSRFQYNITTQASACPSRTRVASASAAAPPPPPIHTLLLFQLSTMLFIGPAFLLLTHQLRVILKAAEHRLAARRLQHCPNARCSHQSIRPHPAASSTAR
jgi:hypothetical protein